MTGGFCCSVASALLPSSALRLLSPLVLLASAPPSEREGTGQKHAATKTAERQLPVLAIKIQQATRLALLEHLEDLHARERDLQARLA